MNSPKGTCVFLTFTRRIYTLTAFSASLFGVKLAQHASRQGDHLILFKAVFLLGAIINMRVAKSFTQ